MLLHLLTYITTRPNSSQLFPNLEATCNSLLFLSTPLPQGTKLSGLLKLWLHGALTWNFSGKNREIGTTISSSFRSLLDTLAWLHPARKLLCFTDRSKSEHVLKGNNTVTGVLFWFLIWTLAVRLELKKKKKIQNVNSSKILCSWSTARTNHYSLWLVPLLEKLKNMYFHCWVLRSDARLVQAAF